MNSVTVLSYDPTNGDIAVIGTATEPPDEFFEFFYDHERGMEKLLTKSGPVIVRWQPGTRDFKVSKASRSLETIFNERKNK